MAIQVGGTTVINNSRALSNIASVDATTAASITAAGVGGGGEIELTAAESITAGEAVGINASSKVTRTDLPKLTTFFEDVARGGNVYSGFHHTYDSSLNKVMEYRSTTFSNYEPRLLIYDVNTSTGSASYATDFKPNISYQNGYFVYNNRIASNNNGGLLLVHVDGYATSNIVYTPGSINSSNSFNGGSSSTSTEKFSVGHTLAYTTNNTFLHAGYNDSSGGFKVKALQTNGSTSFSSTGSYVTLTSANGNGGQWDNLQSSIDWNPNQSRAICLHATSSTSGATWSLLSLSGTTVTKVSSGSVPGTSGTSRNVYVSCSKTDGQVVACWHDDTSDIATYVAGTISGSSVSWGTPVNYNPTRVGSQTITCVRVAYNGPKNGFASEIHLRNSIRIIGNFNVVSSGNAISAGNKDTVSYFGTNDWFYNDTSMRNSPELIYADNWYIGTTLNNDRRSVNTRNVYAEGNIIGVANSSASANGSVKVTTLGGVNTSQSGLTAGAVYGVSTTTGLLDASVSPAIGRALSSTDFYVTGLES